MYFLPVMSDNGESSARISFGTEIFDGDGNKIGTIRAFDEHGFYVTVEEGIKSLSGEHITAGAPGEAELMWRCWECGEMGEVEDIPEECPSCGAPKEDIYYWQED
jgi:Zn finger protein HypA/HybF involved in hydrogenase expression